MYFFKVINVPCTITKITPLPEVISYTKNVLVITKIHFSKNYWTWTC